MWTTDQLTENFSRAEIAAASGGRLSESEAAAIRDRLLLPLVQPARDALGPIRVTSAIRRGDPKCHGQAMAIDLVPVQASMTQLFAWLAVYRAGHYGELIQERDHVHVTAPPCGGRGELLVEAAEGRFVPVTLAELQAAVDGIRYAGPSYPPAAPSPATPGPEPAPLLAGANRAAVAVLLGVVVGLMLRTASKVTS